MVQTSASFRSNPSTTDRAISLSEVISALSHALDLTEGAFPGHALRSCLLGMRIATELNLGELETSSLYFALLLKDVGRTSSSPRIANGARIVNRLGLGHATADAVRSLNERWDGGGYPDALRGEQIPLLSRICAVAQHLDVVSGERGIEAAIKSLGDVSGTWFDPELVRIALSLHRRGVLWVQCLSPASQDDSLRAVLDLDAGRQYIVRNEQVDQICEAFAEVVDAKSHFTFRHSVGVADTAFSVARRMGLAPERVQLVRRAALLHDLGKLSLSNSLLDKTTHLNATEWKAVYRHPLLTRQVLERVGAFQEMAIIAGEHHEKLDGSGYPNRLVADDLSIESRIVAVADVYSALSEDRPYRAGLAPQQIISILAKLAPKKLDSDCVDALITMMTEEMIVGLAPLLEEAVPQFCA